MMASKMIYKFDKYWEVINMILSVASVLDPRRKMECVSLYFHALHGDSGDNECEKVKRFLLDLALDYEYDVYYKESSSVAPSYTLNDKAWWNAETSKYPTLSRIARDILAVPISTVASESAFSAGGRVVSSHRSRLHQDTVEALMCLQSWRFPQFKGITSGSNCQFASVFEDEDVDDSEVLP
uniref:Transposase n=1 Tax=Chenopodium quinoa TaxID=63459 RepID=A0A803N6A5_CHEQI